jgi:hypothetical protein
MGMVTISRSMLSRGAEPEPEAEPWAEGSGKEGCSIDCMLILISRNKCGFTTSIADVVDTGVAALNPLFPLEDCCCCWAIWSPSLSPMILPFRIVIEENMSLF